MWFSLHLVILFVSFSCKAKESQTDFIGLKNDTISTHRKNMSDIPNYSFGDENSTHTFKTNHHLTKQNSSTSNPTTLKTHTTKTVLSTTNNETDRLTSNQSHKIHTITQSTSCTFKEDKHKTGIIICIIIIAVLVLICAVLIICSVALANKVSSLKRKLTQSKRQARSNGDFLSASSLLWPSGMETWQKQPQEVNQATDEISLRDANNSTDKDKHKLMATLPLEKQMAEDKTTTLTKDELMKTTVKL